MPTIISHPAVLLALHPVFKLPTSILVMGAICTAIPDADVIGFRLGIRYGDVLGHRGFSHSLFFALILSAAITFTFFRNSNELKRRRFQIFVFLFLCTASHGVFDALTDGGLGVAFFSPFSSTRYFFPVRPIEVSPIGIFHFLSGPVISVLTSEFLFIWLPCLVLFLTDLLLTKSYGNNP
jgi:inner membrane protein